MTMKHLAELCQRILWSIVTWRFWPGAAHETTCLGSHCSHWLWSLPPHQGAMLLWRNHWLRGFSAHQGVVLHLFSRRCILAAHAPHQMAFWIGKRAARWRAVLCSHQLTSSLGNHAEGDDGHR